MKKKLLFIFIVILLTGCTKIDQDSDDYVNVVNNILSMNNSNVNTVSLGYKFYTPIGVNLVYDDQLNKKFKVDNNEMFLYVDIVSYYYKNNLNYQDTDECYYYKPINDGYIYIVEEENNKYFLKIVYNYAKIETYVKKENLIEMISYSTIILNSITYNDNLISNYIEKGLTFGSDIEYEIEKPDDSKSKFSEYLQEYIQDTSQDDELLPEK